MGVEVWAEAAEDPAIVDPRLLHVLPGTEAADPLVVHLLGLGRLLGLRSEVDEEKLSRRKGACQLTLRSKCSAQPVEVVLHPVKT